MQFELERNDFRIDITATFVVQDLTNNVSKRSRTRLQERIAGAWSVELDFPQTQAPVPSRGSSRNPDSSTSQHLLVQVDPIPATIHDHLGPLAVTLSLTSVDPRPVHFRAHSFQINPFFSADAVEGRPQWIQFMSWSELWTDNPDVQNHDGFRLLINIKSNPPPAQPGLTPPVIHSDILQLIDGHDVIDTKFLVFSRRRKTGDRVGATDPLPVYANSSLIRSQCPYFDDGRCSSNQRSEKLR
jgi:hypothetical protein